MEFGIKNIIFILVFITALVFFAKNTSKLVKYLKLAKADNRFDRIAERIKQTLFVAIFQTKILRDKKAGPIHAGIFWGFLILLFAAVNSVLTGFGIHHLFNILGPVYSVITILTDVFIFLIIVAVISALTRRYVFKVKRLQGDESEKFDAAFILGMIFVIVTSLNFENASMIVMQSDASWAVRPLAELTALIVPLSAASIIYEICFWVHIIFILFFMNYLPFSKHLHVLTSVPNVFFSTIGPSNKLDTINFEDDTIEKYGASDFEDFKWKTLFDSYTCTHCGRCTSVCPANITGKVLDPREIIVQVRERVNDKAPILLKMKEQNLTEADLSDAEREILDKSFIGDYESKEALWQCTTCAACMQECPVNIEHVPAIIEMRRHLTMMEADISPELQTTMNNLENNASPWAFSPSERADWADGLEVKRAAELGEFDVLFWVGCAGSFDDRAKKVSVAFSQIMQKAGINFAILGEEEQCNGDAARRAGNEYLADTMIKANIETISQYKFKKIVATCPHCFNSFKNDFPMFGGKYEVVHHTTFIMELLKQGKITLDDTAGAIDEITYHDSCYMGRYNNIYDDPRNTLKSVPGLKLKEVARSRDKGLCCGAGGAQMFMEETQGKRVNIERTEELLESGSKTIAVNCPFCMTMITDGVKSKDIEDVKVKDIAEILNEKLK